jgi:hypothetical protein
MEIIRERIGLGRLRTLAHKRFGDLVKAVVDVERGVSPTRPEPHAHEEAAHLDDGLESSRSLGINLYPAD